MCFWFACEHFTHGHFFTLFIQHIVTFLMLNLSINKIECLSKESILNISKSNKKIYAITNKIVVKYT